MNVTLRSIDRDNRHECIRLALKPEQEGFMPSNLFHIAEARFYPEWTLLGVYADSRMVGFAMYGLDPDDMTVNFIHFMIDGREQGKGYGKAAMEQLLRKIRNDYPDQAIWLSLHPQNTAAIRLYKDYGFEFQVIGLETDDEVSWSSSGKPPPLRMTSSPIRTRCVHILFTLPLFPTWRHLKSLRGACGRGNYRP